MPDHLAQPAAAGLLLVAVANAVTHLVLTEQPRQTTYVMLAVAAAGVVLLSLRWLAATLYLAWGAWGVGAFLVGPGEQWVHYVIGMCGATAGRRVRQPSPPGECPRAGGPARRRRCRCGP